MKTKTPFLSGFPHFLFGRAKASAQERLRKERRKLIDQSPGELSAQLCEAIDPQLVANCAENQRRRLFTNEVTFWAFLSQVLSEDGSCARAVAAVQSWSLDHDLVLPSADTSSYCKARQRLPLAMLDAIHDEVTRSLDGQMPGDLRWHGHIVKAFDGSSVQLPDTVDNQQQYPQPGSQQPGCGFPVMKIAGLINLCHGGWDQFVLSDLHAHDVRLLDKMLPGIGKDEVLVADRAFCSYEMFARSLMQQSWLVARLHQKRKADWRRGRKIAPDQRIVTWCKPQQPSGSSLSAEQWAGLPEEINIRLIKVKTRGRDGKAKEMILASNLLDAEAYPAEDIAQLYCDRWNIELRLRDLKTTMGMEMLRTKTPEMARKEVAMFVIAYNALRLLMLRASIKYNSELWRISFQGSLQLIQTWSGQFRGLQHKPIVRASLVDRLLCQIAQRIVPSRPGRHEPRALKRRPKPFPLLTKPRAEYDEIQHRSRYRKAA